MAFQVNIILKFYIFKNLTFYWGRERINKITNKVHSMLDMISAQKKNKASADGHGDLV